MYAISTNVPEIAAVLLSNGASVNFVAQPHGWTPLMVALAQDHAWWVEWLLDRGADPEATIAKLSVTLDNGTMCGHEEGLRKILERRRHEGRGAIRRKALAAEGKRPARYTKSQH